MNCGICNRPLNHPPGRLPRPLKRIRIRKVMFAPAPKQGQGPPLGIPICGHLFHKACLINHWDRGQKRCPTCQEQFNLRQVWSANLPPSTVPGECCSNFEELNRTKDVIQQENRELEEKLEEAKKQNAHQKDALNREAKRLKELEKNPARKILDKIIS